MTEAPPSRPVFSRVCSWCGDVMTDAGPDAPVSHGVCPTCRDLFLQKHKPQEEHATEAS